MYPLYIKRKFNHLTIILVFLSQSKSYLLIILCQTVCTGSMPLGLHVIKGTGVDALWLNNAFKVHFMFHVMTASPRVSGALCCRRKGLLRSVALQTMMLRLLIKNVEKDIR